MAFKFGGDHALFSNVPKLRSAKPEGSKLICAPTADLPLSSRQVELTIVVRLFWCDAILCGRRIFCERFDNGVLARYDRCTERPETILHHLGLALGGSPAAAFANRLMKPVSNDTLLPVVRRRIADQNDELSVIGIDDFAFRRGQTFGTIVCDLERWRPVTLLPDRDFYCRAPLKTGGLPWLAERPSVADRWHLMENSSRAFLDAGGRSVRQIMQAVGSNVVDLNF